MGVNLSTTRWICLCFFVCNPNFLSFKAITKNANQNQPIRVQFSGKSKVFALLLTLEDALVGSLFFCWGEYRVSLFFASSLRLGIFMVQGPLYLAILNRVFSPWRLPLLRAFSFVEGNIEVVYFSQVCA